MFRPRTISRIARISCRPFAMNTAPQVVSPAGMVTEAAQCYGVFFQASFGQSDPQWFRCHTGSSPIVISSICSPTI